VRVLQSARTEVTHRHWQRHGLNRPMRRPRSRCRENFAGSQVERSPHAGDTVDGRTVDHRVLVAEMLQDEQDLLLRPAVSATLIGNEQVHLAGHFGRGRLSC